MRGIWGLVGDGICDYYVIEMMVKIILDLFYYMVH